MSRSPRRRHGRQRGLTLIELVVAIAILGVVGTAVAVAMDLGIRTLGTGGATDRLAGTHDISSFEQQLSGDISRASCISQSPTSTTNTFPNTFGACSEIRGGQPAACRSSSTSFLCVAWPIWSSSICHTAVYSHDPTSGNITRTEYLGATPIGGIRVTTETPTTPTVTLKAVQSPTDPSRLWVSLVTISVTTGQLSTATATPNPNTPKGTLLLRPMATDPTTLAVGAIC